jgi:AcrR family transcriptional regulator
MAAKRTSSKAPAKKASARRSPISRAVGEQRMIDAATGLLRDNPFSSVGVREISAVADVNQGFIHSWFGSQNGLYLRVVQELFASMLTHIEQQPADSVALNPFDPNVRFAIRLLFWLDLNDVDITPVRPQFDKLMEAFSQRLISQVGLTPEAAEAVTMQGSAIGLGTAAFGHLIGADDVTKFAHAISVWRHQLELLAKNPPK